MTDAKNLNGSPNLTGTHSERFNASTNGFRTPASLGFSRSATSGVGHDRPHHLGRHSRWDQNIINFQEQKLKLRSETAAQINANRRVGNLLFLGCIIAVIGLTAFTVYREQYYMQLELQHSAQK